MLGTPAHTTMPSHALLGIEPRASHEKALQLAPASLGPRLLLLRPCMCEAGCAQMLRSCPRTTSAVGPPSCSVGGRVCCRPRLLKSISLQSPSPPTTAPQECRACKHGRPRSCVLGVKCRSSHEKATSSRVICPRRHVSKF